MCASFHPLDSEQFKAFALNPLIGDNLPRVRVTIGHLRPVVVAIVPVLADSTFRGTEGHYAG